MDQSLTLLPQQYLQLVLTEVNTLITTREVTKLDLAVVKNDISGKHTCHITPDMDHLAESLVSLLLD